MPLPNKKSNAVRAASPASTAPALASLSHQHLERRPRRLGFAGSGGSLSTLVDDEEAAPLVTETDSPGDGDDDTASP